MGRSPCRTRSIGGVRLVVAVAAVLAFSAAMVPGALAASRHTSHARAHHKHVYRIHKYGGLDCNGYSRHQKLGHVALACADVHGLRGHTSDWTWNGRFFDNGHYIGHDEPSEVFLSNAPGSGNNVSWTFTVPSDPSALPTVSKPGSDVTHWFELSPATWFSMMMCDPKSYPGLPCTPGSDANAPRRDYLGGGSAFMELQFYPPGFAPWAVAPSADNTHWFSALTIDSLECEIGFVHCNPNCVEPVNFAFIQTNGVPEGPPSPQDQNLASNTPNGQTLLMNPGDRIAIHMWDAAVPGEPGQKAFEVVEKDLTTGQSGFMQASAKNGFMNTSRTDCSGTPFNFQPEYSTAGTAENSPWGLNLGNITTAVETGHFEPCTSLTDRVNISVFGVPDTTWLYCHGPYESASDSGGPEVTDTFCFPFGDTHGDLHSAPDLVTGCLDNQTQNGDLDFDGTSYYADWPTGLTPTTFPGGFLQSLPTTEGRSYPSYFADTDVAASESSCAAGGGTTDCTVPPHGPGGFYPYWSRVSTPGGCMLTFGNVASGPGVNNLGKDAQYGTNQVNTLGYPQFVGDVKPNTC